MNGDEESLFRGETGVREDEIRRKELQVIF
jgi:hypothetical protein